MKKMWWLWCWISLSAWAHPVIYKDGLVMSHMSMSDMSDTYVGYSLTQHWSFGGQYYRLENAQEKLELQLVKVNHLLWRHNGPDSQANIYLHSGFGSAQVPERENRLGWMGGVEADWETRRYFVSGKYLHLGSADSDQGIWVGRVGLSPVMANFQDLQSWAMVQVWHDPISAKEVKITPLLRFFYHNVLWEMGASLKGDMMLNIMIHL
jgi:hypothetical protein